MAYEEKTDWLPDDPINEDDVNRWEKGIKDAHTDLAAHKNDMNNPHKTTKAQIGLGNVDNVQQAAKRFRPAQSRSGPACDEGRAPEVE